MPGKLGVLILHGIGSQKPSYAEGMIRKLKARLRKLKFNPDDVYWEPAYVADILEAKERRLWGRLSANNRMDYKTIRKFFIHNFGDAVAYQRLSTAGIDVYERAHNRIHKHLKKLRAALRVGRSPTEPDRPLVIMAHSLGCYMVSNYVWDIQQALTSPDPKWDQVRRNYFGNDFLEMKTLAGIVTFGCNIPLFSLAYDKYEAITFPSPTLANYFPPSTPQREIKAAAQWVNYYDQDDVLGYPMKPLSASYNKVVTRDARINVGKWLTSWNPFSHNGYWTDKDMTNPVGDMLAGILRLL